MFRIVTLEREFGSGGGAIAVKLARRLGWTLWDHQLTSQIAQRAQVTESAVASCDERVDSRLYRLAKASGGAVTNAAFLWMPRTHLMPIA